MHTGSMCIETHPNHESRGAKAWVLLDRMIQGARSDALRVRLRQLHPTFHQQCGSRDFHLDNQHGSLVHSRMWPGITKGAWRSWRQSWFVCFGFLVLGIWLCLDTRDTTYDCRRSHVASLFGEQRRFHVPQHLAASCTPMSTNSEPMITDLRLLFIVVFKLWMGNNY